MEDEIAKVYPKQIATAEQLIKNFTADIQRRDSNTHPNADGFSPMEVQGETYTEKKDAGSAILAACKAMTNPDPVPLGQYRGFSMDLLFDSFSKEYRINLKGDATLSTALGTDIYGNIVRLDNVLDSLESSVKFHEEQLESTKRQLATAMVEVERPFPQEDELKRKSARLSELNVQLNMDKQENEIVGDELDDDPEPSSRSHSDRER